ncbi:hypothetical protein Q3G72_015740 [Acer saccharum]|nr:hypothetical protein Q3G72_015740 [Acer saccharum]
MLRVTFSEAMILPNKTDWTPSKIIAICSNKSEATTPHKCCEVELFFSFINCPIDFPRELSTDQIMAQVLKLYAWETCFKNVIKTLRKKEFKWIFRVLSQKGYYLVMFYSSPIEIPAVTFRTCYFLSISLNASNVLTFLASLRIAQEQIRMILKVVGIFIDAKVSFSRIVKFLEAPELENTNTRQIKSDNKMDWSIWIMSSEISWDACSSSKATLRNIDLMVKPGEQVVICGEVGSDKSTFLAAILGEVSNINGTGFTWFVLCFTVGLNKLHLSKDGTLKFCYVIIFYARFLCIPYLWQAMGHDHVDTDLDNNIDGYYTLLQSEGIRSSDNVTPFAEAGFFSTMSFWWLNPLVKKGKEKILENEDIPELRSADQAHTCYSIYMEQMNKWKQKGPSDSPSMLLVILFCQWKAILVSGLFAFIKVLALSSSPLFLIAFIKVASGKESFQYEAYALTGGLFLVKCLESLSGRQWYFRTRLIGLQVRSLLSAAIYQKQLQLSNAAKLNYSSGEIVSYATVDAYKIGEFPYWFHQIWATSLLLCFALVFVYYSVGLATVAALITILLIFLASSPLTKLQHKYQTKLMIAQDRRLKAITEALANMKVLKLYDWETHFKNIIKTLRKKEFKWIFRVLSQKGYYLVLFYSSPIVIPAVTFWTCYFLSIPLNASNVFTFLANLRIAQEQIRMIPEVAGIFIEAKVSFSRIVKFLEAPELENTNTKQIKSDSKMDWSIWIMSSEFSWDACSSSKATFRNIHLMVKPGEKEYVMGALFGKTVLLVTHQVDFLPAFDLILLMAGGKILDASIYDKLLDSTPEFQDLVNANKNTAGSKRHFEFASSTRPEGEITETNVGKQLKTPSGDQLIKKEERETGDTGLKPYLQYLSHNKSFLYFFLQFVLHMLFVIAQMIQSYWFAVEIQNSLVSRVKLITIYSVIGCVLPVLLLLRSFSIVVLGKLTSESIFSTLLISLFRAPMSFHDSTPLGRILSRVSSDMSIVDTELAFHLSQAVGSDLNAYSCLLLLGILAWPVLIIIIPMIYFSILLQRYYFASAKELMRMNGTTKSSIASHLAESNVGATTIRAFGQEDGFFSKHLKLIDANACQYFHSSSADEWLVQRLEILCAIVLSSSALAMTLLPLGPSASGFIGMALSYGLSLNVFLLFAVQSHCSAANFIVSVERLEQYMHIPDEAKTIAESRRPADNWPATGKVEITNLKLVKEYWSHSVNSSIRVED